MLERLHNLQTEAVEERNASLARPFAHLGNSDGEMTQNGKKGIFWNFCVLDLSLFNGYFFFSYPSNVRWSFSRNRPPYYILSTLPITN